MQNLTPSMLQKYVSHYDYNVDLEQAKRILLLLDDYCGEFTCDDIQDITEVVIHEMPMAN